MSSKTDIHHDVPYDCELEIPDFPSDVIPDEDLVKPDLKLIQFPSNITGISSVSFCEQEIHQMKSAKEQEEVQ
jgi:hypothetical protein